jgi:hypothetical protein
MRVVAVVRFGRAVEVAVSMRRVAGRCTVVGRHIAGWRPLSPISRLVTVAVAVAVGVLSSCSSGGAESTLDGLKKDPMGNYAPVGFELMSEVEGDRKESGLFTGKPVQAMWIRQFSLSSADLDSTEVLHLVAEEAASAGWEITTQNAYGLAGRKVIDGEPASIRVSVLEPDRYSSTTAPTAAASPTLRSEPIPASAGYRLRIALLG